MNGPDSADKGRAKAALGVDGVKRRTAAARPGLVPSRSGDQRTPAEARHGPTPGTLFVLFGVLALAAALGARIAAVIAYPTMTGMRDLMVYRSGGLIVRHISPSYVASRASPLYDWTGHHGVQFTYSPFAALAFAGVSCLSWTAMRWVTTVASALALGATVWLTFGMLQRPRDRTRVGLTSLVTAVALWTEPVQATFAAGQINALLMAAVVADMAQRDTRWWKGVGVGLAAGVKLVPLIFIPYLLLIRKFRQAAVALGTFCATVAFGFAVLPRDSSSYWLDGLFLQANRIVFAGTRGNQSLRGAFTRLYGSVASSTTPWLAAAVLVGLAGLVCAAMSGRAGRSAEGVVVCGLTGLLVSPLTWDHHWVWIAPALAIVVHLAIRAAGLARAAWWSCAAVLAVLFGAYPTLWMKGAPLVPGGLIFYPPGSRFASGDNPGFIEYHWHGLQVIVGNVYIIAGVAALAGLAMASFCVHRRAARAPVG